MNMRNATCVGTQTSKVPTRVTLLFIPYTVVWHKHNTHVMMKDHIIAQMLTNIDEFYSYSNDFSNYRFFTVKLILIKIQLLKKHTLSNKN